MVMCHQNRYMDGAKRTMEVSNLVQNNFQFSNCANFWAKDVYEAMHDAGEEKLVSNFGGIPTLNSSDKYKLVNKCACKLILKKDRHTCLCAFHEKLLFMFYPPKSNFTLLYIIFPLRFPVERSFKI